MRLDPTQVGVNFSDFGEKNRIIAQATDETKIESSFQGVEE